MRPGLIILFLCLVAMTAYGQATLTEFPRSLQLYPRGTDDSAVVAISGVLNEGGWDSLVLVVYRNNFVSKRFAIPAHYNIGGSPFSFSPKIRAELAEYKFHLFVKVAQTITQDIRKTDSVVSGDVYLIAGQSNAVLGRRDVTWQHEYCRTFGIYNSVNPADTNWALSVADTNYRNPVVGIWALNLQKKLVDAYQIPVCIINGAVGGKSIESMLRNNGDPTKLTTIYGMMLNRVRKAGLAAAAKAIFWYQGESNNATLYLHNFSLLYNSWKTDYPNLQKVYVFQIRPGCNVNREHAVLREIQRSLPKHLANIRTISTMGIPYHDGCHFTTEGYEIIADRVFRILSQDFYGAKDTTSIDGPNIARAFYTDATRTELALVFSPLGSVLSSTPDVDTDTLKASLTQYFYLDKQRVDVLAVRPKQDTVFLTLMGPTFADSISYLPDKYYMSTLTYYEGPWIVNERGIGAFSFWQFPIDTPPAAVKLPETSKHAFALYPNPASGIASFVITLEHDDNITIELYDLLGRRVKTIANEALAAGSYKIPFQVESWFEKVMIARLRNAEGIHSLQAVFVR